MLIAINGISAINSREAGRVRKFKSMLFLVGISRVLFNVGMIELKRAQASKDEWSCTPAHLDELYAISAILEAAAITVLLFLIHTIQNYMKGNFFNL